jgi:hypothetical protein
VLAQSAPDPPAFGDGRDCPDEADCVLRADGGDCRAGRGESETTGEGVGVSAVEAEYRRVRDRLADGGEDEGKEVDDV